MSIINLDKMFSPESVALFGASAKEGSVGDMLRRNLMEGGFDGPIWLVNPVRDEIAGQRCYKNAKDLPDVPDMAVIATPLKAVAETVEELGEVGTRACVIITAGVRQDEETHRRVLKVVEEKKLRIVGPNCLGIMVPGIGLNASFSHLQPSKGELAFLSQSGAIITSVLDWAEGRGIGFSSMVSMGDMSDVSVSHMLDFVASDPNTSAILMYLEMIMDARKFMSAARAAARIKPVVVIKSGRHEAGAAAAASHTGALAGADNVYGAAFERSGILRVTDLEELFDAAEILSRQKPGQGDRLAIVTNGGGAGVLAVDRLMDVNGTLAEVTPETVEYLDTYMPAAWSRENPIDILGDAPPERYEKAVLAALEDENVDATLVMNCPTALISGIEAAKATIKAVHEYQGKSDNRQKIVLTNWLGDATAREARHLLSDAGIPSYDTPADAIQGYSYLTGYVKAQNELMRCPPGLPDDFSTDLEKARAVIRPVIESGREMLTESEAKQVLSAYGIKIVPTYEAEDPDAAYEAAKNIAAENFSEFVLKILSKDISHKSDSGGVVLNIDSPEKVKEEAVKMLERVGRNCPGAKLDGFTVQPMIKRSNAHELIIGVSEDVTFGPVILFGTGGTAVEVIKDRAVSLPPLDLKLAREQMQRTNIYKLLQGYRDVPPADLDAIALTLVRISHMIAELPEIYELDINPLLADEHGALALDARVVVKETDIEPDGLNPRFSIRPYPKRWEQEETLQSGMKVFIRPIRPEDETLYETFTDKTEPDDQRMRLFRPIKKLPREFIARLTQIDYARAMAFAALDENTGELLGISRLSADPSLSRAEYGVIVRSDMKGKGLGWTLMQKLISYARTEGLQEIWGHVLPENNEMLDMCREIGFEIKNDPDIPGMLVVTLPLEN
jgi:acetyltransferase